MKPKIYLLPGLAADWRLYHKYRFDGYKVEVIEWIEPEKGESFDAYIERFSRPIDTTSPFVLVGTSLGGIAAGHIAQRHKPQLVVLLSSIKHAGELPRRWKTFRYLPLHKVTPVALVKGVLNIYRLIVGRSKNEEAKLLADMVDSVTPRFFRWGAHQAIHFKRPELADVNHIQIHGKKDGIFPVRYIKSATHFIDEGDHFMVFHHAKKINKIILDAIERSTVKK